MNISDSANLNNSESYASKKKVLRKISFCQLLVLMSLVSICALGMWSYFNQVSYEPPVEGSRVRVLDTYYKLRSIPVNIVVVPGTTQGSTWMLGDGFAQPDSAGAWITALDSVISFSTETSAAAPVLATLALTPLVAESRNSRLIKISTSAEVITKRITSNEMITIALDGQQNQVIKISCDHIDSPYDLKIGPDYQEVCAKLLSLELSTGGIEP